MASPCPHLASLSHAHIQKRLSNKKFALAIRNKKIACNTCSLNLSKSTIWVCLADNCEYVGCGRQTNKHSLNHAQQRGHPVCLRVGTGELWCYECDREIDAGDESACGHLDLALYRQLVCPPEDLPRQNSGSKAALAASNREIGGLVGLKNLGNTCYMNAALQCVSNCPSFSQYFVNCCLLPPGKIANAGLAARRAFTDELMRLMASLWSIPRVPQRYADPDDFRHSLVEVNALFQGYSQHDSQEFLRTMLDSLHEELRTEVPAVAESPAPVSPGSPRSAQSPRKVSVKKEEPVQKKYTSPISQTFEGSLLSEVTCGNCDKVSEKLDGFFDLSLSIPTKKQKASLHAAERQNGHMPPERPERTSQSSSGSGGSMSPGTERKHREGGKNWLSGIQSFFGMGSTKPTTIEDCLSGFCQKEDLTGHDRYKCEHCKELNDSQKKFSIVALPEVLCIHLKRFRFDAMFGSKVTSHVAFPLDDLDMRPYLSKRHKDVDLSATKYTLSGIINHRGQLGGGHYVAYCKNHLNQRWYEFDDSNVSQVNDNDILRVEAYVLFYRRKWRDRDERERRLLRQHITETDPHAHMTSLSLAWWNRFLYHCDPGPVTNHDFTCPHLKIDERYDHSRGNDMKLSDRRCFAIPEEIYRRVVSQYGGGPTIPAALEVCERCEEERAYLQQRKDHERSLIQQQDKNHVSGEECWYLIDAEWLAGWRDFTSDPNAKAPGPISNNRLVHESGAPKKNLFRVRHYRGVNHAVWNIFHEAYGGGPTICRLKLDLYDESPMPEYSEPM